jgi:ABC-type transport system involved in multi-copper enzyme maturation permease subunit
MSATQTATLGAAVRMRPSGRVATNVLAAEWTKLRSLRSTWWTLLIAAVTTIGLSAMISAIYVAQYATLSAQEKAGFDAASFSLTGGVLAQFAIAVLGVKIMTSEYGSGMIRTTFTATPQRLTVLAAKIAVFSTVSLAVTTAACFVAFFLGQAILAGKGLDVGIGEPGVLRTVIGTSLYLGVLGLLSLGIGGLIRKTAGAISAVVGIIFVLPVLTSLLPSSLDAIQKYLPANAGQAIITGGVAQGATSLSPWIGLGVFFLYAVTALGAAAYTLVRRDA